VLVLRGIWLSTAGIKRWGSAGRYVVLVLRGIWLSTARIKRWGPAGRCVVLVLRGIRLSTARIKRWGSAGRCVVWGHIKIFGRLLAAVTMMFLRSMTEDRLHQPEVKWQREQHTIHGSHNALL
jgi:hypothetical protein